MEMVFKKSEYEGGKCQHCLNNIAQCADCDDEFEWGDEIWCGSEDGEHICSTCSMDYDDEPEETTAEINEVSEISKDKDKESDSGFKIFIFLVLIGIIILTFVNIKIITGWFE